MDKSSKIQVPREPLPEQWQLPVPSQVVQQMAFQPDDTIEWIIVDQNTVVLHRAEAPLSGVKKNPSTVGRLFR